MKEDREKGEEWEWECMKKSESKKNAWMNESLRIYMAILPHIVGTIMLQLCCNLVYSFFLVDFSCVTSFNTTRLTAG